MLLLLATAFALLDRLAPLLASTGAVWIESPNRHTRATQSSQPVTKILPQGEISKLERVQKTIQNIKTPRDKETKEGSSTSTKHTISTHVLFIFKIVFVQNKTSPCYFLPSDFKNFFSCGSLEYIWNVW